MSEPKEADNTNQENEEVFATELDVINKTGWFEIPVKRGEQVSIKGRI